ncbi:hypothetical protein HO173_009946 [Letharia columbiana]|uniref:C2H2-type domain-containing protein n=1 Tax=Letharia columbiana TaxID=112416 RepID=A0A8H6FNM9_9LECA|nr:uncharacterized protein HO173_009946 [Letharia columbiana]KAF6231863.1 hypothetical protein HO173_009946 [Letharia columbiana]
MPAAATATASVAPVPKPAKPQHVPDKKYKCQFCARAFSRSEHRSRHERSHTKERPFKCAKCRSTFVRRDLLLRHDRTVHAKDGGVPLVSEVKRRPGAKPTPKATPTKPSIDLDTATMEQIEASSDATAALANNPNDQLDETSTPYSPDHTTMFDTSVPFMPGMPGSMPINQMPWDHFMSNSLSFNSTSTVQPHPNQLPPMMERYPSGGDALAPGLQSLTGSMPISGPATPNGLSPFPFMTGPVSPVDYRRSPGPSQPITTPKVPQLQSDEDYNMMQEAMKRCDNERTTQPNFEIQSRGEINACLESYFKLFHHHLPFLHLESFEPSQVSPALLLSVLSIGALYSFNQDKAFMFHIGSKLLVSQFLQNKESFSSRKCPLWTMQSTLLNMIFASWSGDPKGLEWAGSIKSLVANMVAGNRYELKIRSEAREGAQPTHAEWVEDEGCRRTYYAVYIFFGLLTLTYDHTPAISFKEFETLELPSSESLWNLEVVDEDSWRDSLTASTIITVREAIDSLYQGDATRYSAFATRVMINALFLAVWEHKRNFEALQDVVTEYKLRLALETWEKSLEKCEPETIVVQLSAPHQGHPLIFNAMALYRNTWARLEVDLKSVQEALRYHDSYEVAAAMTNARDKVKRSQEMIKVIEECYNCIEIVALQGIKWVGETCATNWSVEHPLCGLDLMVILSLWLYRLEHDEVEATTEELAMYNKVRNLFDDESVDGYSSKLSSTVARLWGSMLDEVVVWGITKLMGESFKLHSQALAGYEDAVASGTNASTPTMSSQGVDLDMDTTFQSIQA